MLTSSAASPDFGVLDQPSETLSLAMTQTVVLDSIVTEPVSTASAAAAAMPQGTVQSIDAEPQPLTKAEEVRGGDGCSPAAGQGGRGRGRGHVERRSARGRARLGRAGRDHAGEGGGGAAREGSGADRAPGAEQEAAAARAEASFARARPQAVRPRAQRSRRPQAARCRRAAAAS